MSKEPNRYQLSSRLSYNAKTPAFLLKFQRQVGGQTGGDEDEEDPEFEYVDDSGRPPIPRRPAIPERPQEDPGSADEDDADEKPQVVVLKEGKHLSEREVENEKRKVKGLSPLPEEESEAGKDPDSHIISPQSKVKSQSLSFSSSAATASNSKKRKAVGDVRDKDDSKKKIDGKGKKSKKAEKKLLSFDDEA